jgi:hypothetical protein
MRTGPLEQVEQEHQQERDDDPKREISQIIQVLSFSDRQGNTTAPPQNAQTQGLALR